LGATHRDEACLFENPAEDVTTTAAAIVVGAASDLVAGTNIVEKIIGNYDEVTV
jgi:hypothetical protein